MKRAVVLFVALVSCRTTDPPTASKQTEAPVATAHDALDRLDRRAEVPLLPMMAHHQKQNMRDHLAAVQEVVAALATSDFATIEASAARLGTSPQMKAMCTHMGAGAPGFGEQALAFHGVADGIATAAKKKDRDAVLAALSATLATCTGCHAKWKQRVVDEATYQRVTSQAPPHHMH